MADWPDGLKTGPIREWPGTLRAHGVRERAKFMRPGRYEETATGRRYIAQSPMPLTRTLKDLNRELEQLKAKNAELLVAIPPGRDWRLDGKPRADAKPEHPGVILTFEIPNVGVVSYPCDKYTRWEDNLRAIVLALEALRLVDRHGVTRRGEQYRGFLAIEATPSSEWASSELAAEFIRSYIASRGVTTIMQDLGFQVRQAMRLSHPDMPDGDAEIFRKVMTAEKRLREAGLLG